MTYKTRKLVGNVEHERLDDGLWFKLRSGYCASVGIMGIRVKCAKSGWPMSVVSTAS